MAMPGFKPMPVINNGADIVKFLRENYRSHRFIQMEREIPGALKKKLGLEGAAVLRLAADNYASSLAEGELQEKNAHEIKNGLRGQIAALCSEHEVSPASRGRFAK